jgi:centromere protein I
MEQASVTLEEIDSAGDFVEKLERIEPPGQLISFLTDPLLQKYVALRPSPIASARIDLWLSTCLEEEYNAVQSGHSPSANLTEILEGLHRQAQYTKVATFSIICKATLTIYRLYYRLSRRS